MRVHRRECVLIGVIALLLAFELGRLIGSGSVVAAALKAGIPDKKGLIHACYTTSGGAVRVIDPRMSCRAGETRFSWSQSETETRLVRDASVPSNFTCASSSQFPGYCIVATMPVPRQPIELSYMCQSQAGVWQYPGPIGGPNSSDYLCYGDVLVWTAGTAYVLHKPSVSLDQTRHIRVQALYPAH